MFQGKDIIAVATRHVDEKYVYGSRSPLANPHWSGPWDCAEFVTWCAYQAYKIIFGARPPQSLTADAYSGYWCEDAETAHATIAWNEALRIPGAILVRAPRSQPNHPDGHVAIALGDGTTVEARGKLYGVGIFPATDRPWSLGVLLPGILYDKTAPAITVPTPDPCYAFDSPFQRGPAIVAIQAALAANGVHPGNVDGVFGQLTQAAVLAFQKMHGLTADGIVGRETATALGLEWPIKPLAQDMWRLETGPASPSVTTATEEIQDPPRPARADLTAGVAVTFSFEESGGHHFAKASTGQRLYIGSGVSYRDDMPRFGLCHRQSLQQQNDLPGLYDPAAFDDTHPHWNYFLKPTIMAESNGHFGCVNTYDRAAFTFGCYQFAGHTPGENLILLFRKLLQLPDAGVYFPDLRLVDTTGGEKCVQRLDADGTLQNLELVSLVTRPNGTQERQLLDFMRYLNSSPVAVDPAEKLAVARLLLWCGENKQARAAQIELAGEIAARKLAAAVKKVPELAGKPWPVACMVSDILHQGRGRYTQIAEALQAASPLDALSGIGTAYIERIRTVRNEIAGLEKTGVLTGWSPV